MPSIDKLLPRSLNQDDDERLVKATEMTDAQNVRVSVDVEKDSLVLKNAWGNTLRSGTIQNGSMPSGTNVTIGSVGDDSASQVYYFVYNSNGDHSIFRYDQNAKKTYLVYQDSILQFSSDAHVDASIVRLSNGDILIYFNDGRSAPKKINATTCEESIAGNGGYPSVFSTGTAAQRLEYITAAKAPPMQAPVLTFVNNPSFPTNNIYTKNFQFAYQYEYFDGEQSALSPYSRLSVSPNQLKDGFNTAGQENFYNQINIAVNNSTADVSRIKVYGRLGDKDAAFFLIDTVDNVNGTGTQTISFRNDSNYIGLSASVQDKLYDNVPQKADSQAISQGRLFYGGYTEGYDNLSQINATAVGNYNEKPDTYSIDITQVNGATTNSVTKRLVKVDCSSLPSSFTEDSVLFLSFTWNDGAVTIRNLLDAQDNRHYNFVSDTPNITILNESTAGFPEELKALAGLKTNTFGQTGLNIDGSLNVPPTIRFTKQKRTSDTEEKDIAVRSIRTGIKVVSSGIQVREQIEIAQGTTRAQVLQAIRVLLQRPRPISFEPQEGSAGFSNIWTGGQTSNVESANFKGKGTAWMKWVGWDDPNDPTYFTFAPMINKVRFNINKFTFGTKEAEVEDPFSIMSSFDIIEGSANSEGENNRIRGIQSVSTPTMDGRFVRCNDQGFERDAIVARNGAYVTTGGSFIVSRNNMFGSRCFKSGSSHEFGIVYFDDRGRAGGVQQFIDETYIKHTNNRTTENNLDGFANVTVRIQHNPPSWAKRYSVVYAGQGSVINKVQYGIGGAYLAYNDDTNEGAFGATKNIYLSLNTLQSKNNSYDNQVGADINYGYAAGDLLRIVRYGDNQKSTAIWRVAKVVNLLADQLTNPLLDRSSKAAVSNTTGDFLVIEDNGTAGFNFQSVANDNSNWNNDCIIEIYRPSKAFDNLFYYEIGENHAIVSGSHVGERTSTTPTVYISGPQAAGTIQGYSNVRVYKGDKIQTAGGAQIIVGNVMVAVNDTVAGYPYKFYGTSLSSWTTGTYSMTVQNPDCVLNIDQGDSYFRLRTLFVGASPQPGDIWKNIASAYSQNAIVDFIEDPRVSDFFESAYTSLGRRFVYSPDAKSIKRFGSVTYSDAFNIDNITLGLSSFNMTKANWKDLSYDYGSIRSLVPYDELMYVIHERRAGMIPVSRNILTADAGDTLVASPSVLGPVKYYVGEYGCNDNPESVANYRGYVFFVDAKAGKVCRINYQTGIDIISEQLMDAFFKSKMFATFETATNRRYIGGIDRENTEYIISSPALSTSTLTIQDDLSGNTVTGAGRTDSGGLVVEVTPVYSNDLTFNWDSDPRDFNINQDQAQDSGKALIIVDQLTNQPIIAMSEDLSPSRVDSLSAAVPAPAMTSSFSAFTTSTFSQSTSQLTFTASPDSSGAISSTSETLPSFTIAYDIRSTWWSTRYSYIAEEIMSLSDRLYTFKNGLIYEHNPDAARNTYYGTAGDSIVEVVSNFNPSMVKAYEAVSLEGNNSSWSCVIDTTDQTSTIASSIWQNKEGFYYAPIHRDSSNNITYTATANVTSVSGTSELFSLGVVASVSTSVITFKNAINNMSFPLGNTTALFLLNSASNRLEPLNLYASSISGEKALTCSGTVSGVSADDEIVLVANSAIEGDNIRDYYLKARFANSTTTPHELYAVNFIYSKSNLHNQQGQ